MPPKFILYIHLLIIILWIPALALSQGKASAFLKNEAAIYQHTENIYGANDLLIKGQIYIPTNSKAANYPYFDKNAWSTGMVFIKGSKFPEVTLKYDIEQDVFILKNLTSTGENQYIALQKGLIDTVELEGHFFVNSHHILPDKYDLGYVEMIYRGDYIFFTKYFKQFKKVYSDLKPYGEYGKQQHLHYIYKDGNLKKLPSKSTFLTQFSEQKKALKKYLKKNKINYKDAPAQQIRKLISYCNEESK
ncbi:MAG: hypothetical protein K9G76_01900 [Bacteroidales bacterium]|nr:hypothetical protein [Bacteroidales bacterium]MCF8403307.1 hypothetical protein [Bacteroidales bacterium]